MKKEKGFVVVAGLLVLVFWVAVICSWIGNAYKLMNCDFEAEYKCEIVHAIGLVPVLSLFTVWNDDK